MMVTVAEAAKELGCSKANIYELLKTNNVKTERVTKEIEYTTKQRVTTMIFDLDDLRK